MDNNLTFVEERHVDEPGTPGRTPWLPTAANVEHLPEGVRNYAQASASRAYALQQALTQALTKAGDYHDAWKGVSKECCNLRGVLRDCRHALAAKQVECDGLKQRIAELEKEVLHHA